MSIHDRYAEQRIAAAEHDLVEAHKRIGKLEGLVRDMHRVIWACREVDCPHRKNGCFRVKGDGDGECWFEQRIRDLGLEVD